MNQLNPPDLLAPRWVPDPNAKFVTLEYLSDGVPRGRVEPFGTLWHAKRYGTASEPEAGMDSEMAGAALAWVESAPH